MLKLLLLEWSLANHFPVLDLSFLTYKMGKLYEVASNTVVNIRIMYSNRFLVKTPSVERRVMRLWTSEVTSSSKIQLKLWCAFRTSPRRKIFFLCLICATLCLFSPVWAEHCKSNAAHRKKASLWEVALLTGKKNISLPTSRRAWLAFW